MTNLDGALRELHAKHPNIKTIAIVTDGGYDACTKSLELFEKAEELILEKNFPDIRNLLTRSDFFHYDKRSGLIYTRALGGFQKMVEKMQ